MRGRSCATRQHEGREPVKKLSVVVLCFLVVAITIFLIWLHDLRASHALAGLQQQVTEKRLVISKLKTNTVILQEFIDADEPFGTRLAAKAKQQNPRLSDDEFKKWLGANAADLRAKALNDIRLVPELIAAREQEVADLQSMMVKGGPWLFYR